MNLLRPPSPGRLALADLGLLLLDALVITIILFFVIDRSAPPQDLPWKPLSLDHPIGMATGGKIARIAADPAACRAALKQGGVAFVSLPPRTDGFCTTLDGVRLTSGVTRLSPTGPVMTCKQALAYALFDRQVLQPAAKDILKTRIASVDHFGTYACRRMYGRKTGRVSEHAHANALDLAGVTLADGRRISVVSHFGARDERGRFLRATRDGACKVFRTTLSPDYNAAHRDHLHLDMGRFRVCR